MATTKKKTTVKTTAVKKPAPVKKVKSTASPEHKAATAALKLVDEAATLLRSGNSTSAKTTEKTRLEAKTKAHSLLNKASSSLADILGTSTSLLRKAINKL